MHRYSFSAALLKKGLSISLEVYGHSMLPTIKHGETVYIVPKEASIYDVVFATYQKGFIFHRIIDQTKDHWILKGDHQKNVETISKEDVLGVYQDTLYEPIATYLMTSQPTIINTRHIIKHELHTLLSDTHPAKIKMTYQVMYQQQRFDDVLHALHDQNLQVIVLKGYALSHIYPKDYLRTKGDLDIYVEPIDLKRVITHLEALGFRFKSKNDYHKVYNQGDLHIEVHHDLGVELPITINDSIKFHHYNILKHDIHLIYLLKHLLKHLKHGGIGMKHIMDIWFLASYGDVELLKKYDVYAIFQYVIALKDELTHIKLDEEIDQDVLHTFKRMIKVYGVHGNMHIRIKNQKSLHTLWNRYIVSPKRFKYLASTLKSNSMHTLLKKLWILIISKKNHAFKHMLNVLEGK